MPDGMRIVMLGLSVTSSWGNGHATNYRGLMRALAQRGHDVLFLERDMPWYADNRDLPRPPFGRTLLYGSLEELRDRFAPEVRDADAVLVGSYVPDGTAVGGWVLDTARGVRAFYDIDTPVTLAKLARGEHEYLSPELIPRYDLYLSFTGGPTLERIEREHGSPRARAFYCLVDPSLYFPAGEPASASNPPTPTPSTTDTPADDLGYLGTYSVDRQPVLDRLLMEPARRDPAGRYVVAGPQYPKGIAWPAKVRRLDHCPPAEHRRFYTSQRFTLNITRADMVRAGYSPSVRIFEAAACGTPVISDPWPGLETILEPGREILLARSGDDVLRHLREVPECERREIGRRARARVLREHTAEHRAAELEGHIAEAGRRRSVTRRAASRGAATGVTL